MHLVRSLKGLSLSECGGEMPNTVSWEGTEALVPNIAHGCITPQFKAQPPTA